MGGGHAEDSARRAARCDGRPSPSKSQAQQRRRRRRDRPVKFEGIGLPEARAGVHAISDLQDELQQHGQRLARKHRLASSMEHGEAALDLRTFLPVRARTGCHGSPWLWSAQGMQYVGGDTQCKQLPPPPPPAPPHARTHVRTNTSHRQAPTRRQWSAVASQRGHSRRQYLRRPLCRRMRA